jgi:hypothetical protein
MDEDRVSRFACLAFASLAIAVTAWDFVANFVPSDLVGIALAVGVGLWAVPVARRSSAPRRPGRVARLIVAGVMAYFTAWFVVDAVTGSGNRLHDHWFLFGLCIAATWLLLAYWWFPRRLSPRESDRPIETRPVFRAGVLTAGEDRRLRRYVAALLAAFAIYCVWGLVSLIVAISHKNTIVSVNGGSVGAVVTVTAIAFSAGVGAVVIWPKQPR